MSVRPDDPWADCVYDAQRAALGPIGRRFTRWIELVAFVEEVVLDWSWTEFFDDPPLDVGVERRSSSARYSVATRTDSTIWIRSGDWTVPIVLHELAHLATPHPGHGAEFVEAHLVLVRRWCGFHAYGAYASELALRRVPRQLS